MNLSTISKYHTQICITGIYIYISVFLLIRTKIQIWVSNLVSFTDGKISIIKYLPLSGYFMSTETGSELFILIVEGLLYKLFLTDSFIYKLTPKNIQVESLQFLGCNLKFVAHFALFSQKDSFLNDTFFAENYCKGLCELFYGYRHQHQTQ